VNFHFVPHRYILRAGIVREEESDMANYENRVISARVISQKGTCVACHKTGDEFPISDICPAGMCAWAFYTIFPFAQVLMSDGAFPWERDPHKCTVACPDPASPVVFELSRRI
jgi:uncharacterized repeat protein (TIGR04076 family)